MRPYRIGEQVTFAGAAPLDAVRDPEPTRLLYALAAALMRRERCERFHWPPWVSEDRLTASLLRLVDRSHTPPASWAAVVKDAWADRQGLEAVPAGAEAVLRQRLKQTIETYCTDGESSGVLRAEVPALVWALDAVHGLTPAVLANVVDADVRALLDEYVLHDELRDVRPAGTIRRARELLAASGLTLPRGGTRALAMLADDLGPEELSQALCRTWASSVIEQVLDRAGNQAEQLAFDLLRSKLGSGVEPAARLLGDRARPLLLTQLRRRPRMFGRGRSPIARELVGPDALRAAAEDRLRGARDPVEALFAYELLPGDEARGPLDRLLDRTERLKLDVSSTVSVNIPMTVWMLIVTRHLDDLVDQARVARALRDRRTDDGIAALLLRVRPDVAPDAAAQLWNRGWVDVSVLRASGGARAELARDALAGRVEARRDRLAAARLMHALAAEGDGNPDALSSARACATDRGLPATLRAIAAWVAGEPVPELLVPDDPAMARYARWLKVRAPTLADPLAELLTGAWLEHVLVPDAETT